MTILGLFAKKNSRRKIEAGYLGEELVNACVDGDARRISRLLADGADPNYIKNGVFGRENALHYAWGSQQRREILGLLLKHGADPNVRLEDNKGLPFEVACAEGDFETAMLLLRHGASVQTKDSDGWTPLMLAVGNAASRGLVRELLSRGADPNAADNEGWSVLMNASKYGDSGVIEILLKSGANPNARDINGASPLSLAVHFGHLGVAAQLKAAGAR